jgi:hypothetical protein
LYKVFHCMVLLFVRDSISPVNRAMAPKWWRSADGLRIRLVERNDMSGDGRRRVVVCISTAWSYYLVLAPGLPVNRHKRATGKAVEVTDGLRRL